MPIKIEDLYEKGLNEWRGKPLAVVNPATRHYYNPERQNRQLAFAAFGFVSDIEERKICGERYYKVDLLSAPESFAFEFDSDSSNTPQYLNEDLIFGKYSRGFAGIRLKEGDVVFFEAKEDRKALHNKCMEISTDLVSKTKSVGMKPRERKRIIYILLGIGDVRKRAVSYWNYSNSEENL